MTHSQIQETLSRADREKRRVAASSLVAALLLTGTKLGVGLWTNSLGILSEAAHSALDLLAAAATLWAVRISSRPADPEHTYGHGKIENLSALFQTVLLLITCAWIIYEAASRLFFSKAVEVEANVWAFLVVILSIVVDVSRSRALRRAAERHSSQALEADALHFSTDIWSSAVVLLGLCGVLAGARFDMPRLVHADAAAALVVAAIVIGISLRLGKKSVDDLLDGVPRGLHEEVVAAARRVPGVESVLRARLRRGGPQIFADLTVSVPRGEAFERTHDVANRAEDAVKAVLPNADVVVHVEPAAPGEEDVTTVVRLLAARHGLGAHGVRIYEENRQRWLELHLEVGESLLLDEAHAQATEFERDVRRALPDVTRIITHIEPAGDSVATRRGEPAGQAEVRQAINEFLQSYPQPIRPHDLRVQQDSGELAVSFHCELDGTTAITDAHDLTVRLEEHLRNRVSRLGRVAIHVEPGNP